MDKNKHQSEIENSRSGGFGGSDAKLFYKIGSKGLESLSNTDKKRIRVAKGIDEYKPIAQNEAMQRGHLFEEWYEGYLNAPCKPIRELKISKQLAKNFDTFAHIDFAFEMNGEIAECWELKCVQNPEKAESDYMEQLQWQRMLNGRGIFLVVCDSNYNSFADGVLSPKHIMPNKEMILTLLKGIKLLDEAWDTLDLTIGEDWEEKDLMFWEQPEVVAMANYLSDIKALEQRAEEQKSKVLQIMLDNNIKSLKSDLYSITLVPESTANTLDKKKLFAEHPEIKENDYTKSSPKKAYIKVTLRNETNKKEAF